MISFEQASSVQGEAESLLSGAEFEVRDSDCSAYAREFVALAMRLGARLVTVDKKLLRAFPKHATALVAG